MISVAGTLEAAVASLIVVGAIWAFLRWRAEQTTIVEDKLTIEEDRIEKINSALSNAELADKLSKELGGRSTPKS